MGKYDKLNESLSLKFSQKARELNQIGRRIVSLGLGEPSFNTPEEVIEATYAGMKKGLTRYSSAIGLYELREKISKKLISENNINANPNNIIITSGAKFACSLAFMALLESGDEVINITPSYVSYVPQLKIAELNVKIIDVPLNREDFSLDLEYIEKSITDKTKLIIINSPHNPTGRILQKNQIKQLVKLAIENDFYILSDEVYEKLNFSGNDIISPASFQEVLNRVVVVNGFSKSHSMTGFRIGYGLFPERIMSTVIKLQQHLLTNTPAFIQYGAIEALSMSNDILRSYNLELRKSSKYIYERLSLCDKLNVIPSQGGLFTFVNIKATGLDSDNFCEKFLSEKFVATTPGIAFGNHWDDYIRISMAAGFIEVKEGIDLLVEFVETL